MWDVLEASSELSGSSLVLAKVFRLVVKVTEGARIKVISLVCWQELTTQDCLVNLTRTSMRIKCLADEQNFIKEKSKSYVFSECYKHICNQRSQL